MVSLIVRISAMCIYPIIPQHAIFLLHLRACKTRGVKLRKNRLIILLISQYYCNRFSNCMLEHGRSHCRPLDRGQIACDLKWRGMDVHEAAIC